MSKEPPKRWVPKVDGSAIQNGVSKKQTKFLENVEEMAQQLTKENWEKLVEILRAEKSRRDGST